jgi:uncharacterized protein (DUF58 family)
LPDEPAGKLPVRWSVTAHARRLLTLAIAGLGLAILTRRPEFAGLAAPALLLLGTWRSDRPAALTVRLDSPARQVVEGEIVPVGVQLGGQAGYDAELRLRPAASIIAGPEVRLRARPGETHRTPLKTTPAGSEPADQSARLRFQPARWGHRRVGALEIVLRDQARLTEGSLLVELPRIRCAPLPARLESSIVQSKLPSRLGEHPARTAGEGIEFSGVREFVPGDRQRRINWPATTRHGRLYLSTFAAERTQNVVVIADTTADVGEPGRTSLDLVLRGSSGTITRYLSSRDRVGLISYGGGLGWIAPGQGRRHLGRLMDLLVTGAAGGERLAAMTRLPRAALPPGALIIAFSPLLDPRLVEAVRDLRERGFSVLVVDVLNATPRHDRSALSALTGRVWQLEQQAIRYSLTQIGVPVVRWDGKVGLDEPLAPFTRRVLVVRH